MDRPNDQQQLREVLLKIQDLLSDEDRERLHFLLGNHVPKRYREDPSLGGTLRVLETLLDQGIINEEDCHYLIRALKNISCFEAAKKLLDYQQKKSIKTKSSLPTYDMIREMEEDNLMKTTEKSLLETKDVSIQTDFNLQRSWNIREIILAILLSIALIALIIVIVLLLRRAPSLITSPAPSNSVFNMNLVNNGNAETGPCETRNGTSSPIGWYFNGSVTQISYDNKYCGTISRESPGPSNRGNCYFFGHKSQSTSMWQNIDLSQELSKWIDRGIVKFHLSAWLGGWAEQDDNTQVTVTFFDRTKYPLGYPAKIGPIYASDRNGITSLIFRDINGIIPIGTRSARILVEFSHSSQTWNDASIDNISFDLFL